MWSVDLLELNLELNIASSLVLPMKCEIWILFPLASHCFATLPAIFSLQTTVLWEVDLLVNK